MQEVLLIVRGGTFMKTKKIIVGLLLVCVLVAGALTLAACGDLTQEGEKLVNIIIVDAEGEVVFSRFLHLTEELFLVGILNDFQGVGFDITGGFINLIIVNGVSLGTGAEEWIGVFSSSEEETLSMPEWGTITIESTTYSATAVGINEMPLRAGYTYVFAVQEGW